MSFEKEFLAALMSKGPQSQEFGSLRGKKERKTYQVSDYLLDSFFKAVWT